ncbi:hypothetical protein AC579_2420 [Pseudocercospora musae]|uniref:Uncharacterized protein n=1 Tax=Pseudocercospora musae TaxID=113226 RepID=A0A139I9V7_9PEZI|nr:hypothetical protein AC579_2420 [Pseudocercospora musae]
MTKRPEPPQWLLKKASFGVVHAMFRYCCDHLPFLSCFAEKLTSTYAIGLRARGLLETHEASEDLTSSGGTVV